MHFQQQFLEMLLSSSSSNCLLDILLISVGLEKKIIKRLLYQILQELGMVQVATIERWP